ncbi:hypothetical protein PCE1_004420 [Barthelona sp. PCE]
MLTQPTRTFNMYGSTSKVFDCMPLPMVENAVLIRMKLLDAVYNNQNISTQEYCNLLRTVDPDKTLWSDEEGAKTTVYDRISHWVLCMLFGLTEERDHLDFFINAEQRIAKLELEISSETQDISHMFQLPIRSLTEVEKELHGPSIARCHATFHTKQHPIFSFDDVFALRFEMLPRALILNRNIVRSGLVYVHRYQLVGLVHSMFIRGLKERLAFFGTNRERIIGHPLVISLINIPSMFLSARKQAKKTTVFDVEECVPPCMFALFNHTKRAHALKYEGRVQLSRFLVGCDIPYEEAIKIVGKHIGATPKWKQYEYGVKHAYGLVGSRNKYGCYTCSRMILDLPPCDWSSTIHGCPMANMPTNRLKNMLGDMGCRGEAVRKIMEAKDNDPRMGCRLVLESLYDVPEGVLPINNPVDFVMHVASVSQQGEIPQSK